MQKGLIKMRDMKKRSIIDEIVSVNDISNFLLYLVQNNSKYQTGQSFFIDGGLLIKK